MISIRIHFIAMVSRIEEHVCLIFFEKKIIVGAIKKIS